MPNNNFPIELNRQSASALEVTGTIPLGMSSLSMYLHDWIEFKLQYHLSK